MHGRIGIICSSVAGPLCCPTVSQHSMHMHVRSHHYMWNTPPLITSLVRFKTAFTNPQVSKKSLNLGNHYWLGYWPFYYGLYAILVTTQPCPIVSYLFVLEEQFPCASKPQVGVMRLGGQEVPRLLQQGLAPATT